MDLYDIKRELRAEINKRKNEQYATFQCNVSQMCKDVLAKLEEQESVIAELRAQIVQAGAGYGKALKEKLVEYATLRAWAELQLRHQKYKRCIAMANYWVAVSYQCVDDKHRRNAERRHRKWLELSGKFEEEFK